MADIIRITIKGVSWYGPVREAYSDKVTIDLDSIKYEYKPVLESEINVPRSGHIRPQVRSFGSCSTKLLLQLRISFTGKRCHL